MIEALIYILKNVQGDYISPVDYKIFPDYLMPVVFDKFFEKTEESVENQDEMVRFTIVKNLGDIVTIAEQFKYMVQVSISNSFRKIKE